MTTNEDLGSQIEKQRERVQSLLSKRIEIESNYDALKSLCEQITEEVSMGQEDVAAKSL